MPPTIPREYTWDQTEEADAFVASADVRETSPEIMRAIARLADDMDEAVAIWEIIDRRRATSGR
jgi:hypothetical protein